LKKKRAAMTASGITTISINKGTIEELSLVVDMTASMIVFLHAEVVF
jgi:hypothetical protein